MPGGLDHVVHAVRDLEATADLYRRLGFTVGARNRHPWGTQNHLVQLPGFFIELLTMAEPDKLGADGFSQLFARFNQSFLTRQEGLSMLILESRDAAADAAAFQVAGIAASSALSFEREGRRPDGTTVKVGFSLAFARDAGMADVGFATCQQHFPENFWNPAFQQHANSVNGVAGAVLVSRDPAAHRDFLAAFTGVDALNVVGDGFCAATPRGDIEVVTPAAFRARFGCEPPDVASGARFAALRLHVRDRAALTASLGTGGIEFANHAERAIVAPSAARGATLVFEAPW